MPGPVGRRKAETDMAHTGAGVVSRASMPAWSYRQLLVAGFLGGVILLVLGFVVVLRCRARDRAVAVAGESGDSGESGQSLADLSHELRTPMNGILGMIGLALKTRRDDERTEYLRIAKQSAESLLELIDDVEDLSKLSAGTIELNETAFSLRKTLSDTLNVLAARAHRKGLELVCRVESEVPDHLVGDPVRLRQILINLIDNAVKFTEEGEVVVRVERLPEVSDSVGLRFLVRDTGIGIPENQRHLIFEKFGQADNSGTRERGGAGLGLNIASRLVATMGGELQVTSTIDEGSKFYFTVEMQPGPGHLGEFPGLPPSAREWRVLLAEFDDTSRAISREIFENQGLEVVAVKTPVEAAEQLNRFAATRPFDLVFVDARMVTPENPALYAELEELQRTSHASVILLFRAGVSGAESRSGDVTGARFMMKPITEYEVAALMHELRVRQAAVARNSEACDSAQNPSLRILLAEDDVVNQRLAVELLQKENHAVEVVRDGEEAVAAHESGQYDLIFMDLHMPKVDGLKATQIIRARERRLERTTPIVGITARAAEDDRRRCLEAGMDGCLVKPIVPDQLFRSIENAVSESRRNTAGSPEPGRRADRDERLADNIEILNREKLKLVFDEDIDSMKQFLASFLEICPRYVTDVREALEDRNHERLASSSHRLHSALESLQAEAAARVAARLERVARSDHVEDAPEIFERLEREIERLTRVLLDEPVS